MRDKCSFFLLFIELYKKIDSLNFFFAISGSLRESQDSMPRKTDSTFDFNCSDS